MVQERERERRVDPRLPAFWRGRVYTDEKWGFPAKRKTFPFVKLDMQPTSTQ